MRTLIMILLIGCFTIPTYADIHMDAESSPSYIVVSAIHALRTKIDAEAFKCPDGYAYKIPVNGSEFDGLYFRCEDYHKFYKFTDEGRFDEAKKLLLISPK